MKTLTTDILLKHFETINYPSFGFGSIMLHRLQGSKFDPMCKWSATLRNPENWKDERMNKFNGETPLEALTKLYDYCVELKYIQPLEDEKTS